MLNRTKSTFPYILSCRRFDFCKIRSGRSGFATASETKVLDSFTEEFEVGSKLITLETGKIARFANGAVVLGMDHTKVLSTVAASKGDSVSSFLPLSVEYQEKYFAQGVIPNTYMRREGAPKERELLCGRLIDRPIRPLFPAGFYHEVQIITSVLSSDGNQDPDVMAANATSAALMLSDIPWGGPIGVIRIGRICGKFIVNPSMDELSISDLNLVYACTRDKTLMIDVQAREITEKDLEAAMRLAHPEAVKYLDPQIRLATKAGKQKREYTLSMVSEKTMEKVRTLTKEPILAVFSDPSYGKFERGEALEKIGQDVKKVLEEEGDEDGLKFVSKTVDTVRKEVVRGRILAEGVRLDGRQLDEVRPLFCEAGYLPALHGSALFSRGDTQVLCTVTLGAPGDAQRLASIVGPSSKRFMLHYSFPPFCINEVGKRGGLNRREVGHGTLAEKALLGVLPPEDDYPYTVRINSEVMASDGSTSMATVCGGSMALMDAGIQLKAHVAGLSVGLISKVDESTGEIKDYRILTDILGLEDHLGDMDFKIAGTRNGITAIQLDIKPAGIPLDIVCESLEPARKGRLQILDHMEREINGPRAQDARNSPHIVTLKYSNDCLRQLIGPLGVLKRKIEEETGARMSVSDGTLTVLAKNQEVLEKVQEKIDFIIGREIRVGETYKGIVNSVKEYGAFVEFNGGQQGLLHISELSSEPVSRVSDVVTVGQTLELMCIGLDVRGNIKLSLKATLPNSKSKKEDRSREPETPDLNASEPVDDTSKSTPAADQPEKEKSSERKPSSTTPAFIIRRASECDDKPEKQKSSETKPSSTTPAFVIRRASECDDKPEKQKGSEKQKSSKTKKSPFSVPFQVRSASECDDLSEKQKSSEKQKRSEKQKSSKTKPLLTLIKSASECDDKPEIESSKTESLSTPLQSASKFDDKKEAPAQDRIDLKSEEATKDVRMSAKKLKIGMTVKAKVHEIRARGLVLDLGGGIHGMYLYKSNNEREFTVGDKLQVKCSSFSNKGIPIMT